MFNQTLEGDDLSCFDNNLWELGLLLIIWGERMYALITERRRIWAPALKSFFLQGDLLILKIKMTLKRMLGDKRSVCLFCCIPPSLPERMWLSFSESLTIGRSWTWTG